MRTEGYNYNRQADYEVGDIITYRAMGGELRTVEVTEKDENIKNGRPGFDGRMPNDGGPEGELEVWGYDAQIVRIDERAGGRR